MLIKTYKCIKLAYMIFYYKNKCESLRKLQYDTYIIHTYTVLEKKWNFCDIFYYKNSPFIYEEFSNFMALSNCIILNH